MGLVGVYLELRGRCARCGHGVPVNACITRLPCPSCSQPLAVPVDRWESLLGNIVEPDQPLGKTGSISSLSDEMKLDSGREDPRCGGCGSAFPDEIAAFAARGFAMCATCGRRVSVRPPPPELAPLVRGATVVIGEDLAQLAGGAAHDAPKGREPISLNCTNCRAPLSFDGSRRAVRCQYCDTDLYLPDEVWLKLQAVGDVARFYLAWVNEAAVKAAMQQAFQWSSLESAALGTDGNLYCLGSGKCSTFGDDATAVWCMAPDLTLRWITHELGAAQRHFSERVTDDALLTVDPAGRVMVWDGHTRSLSMVSGGTYAGSLGGKQPAGVRALDAKALAQVCSDVDGTLIALINKHLARFAADGRPLDLWPPRSGLFGTKRDKLLPLYDGDGNVRSVDSPSVEQLASYPYTVASYAKICVGWDGCYYALESAWIAKLDRSGKLVYKVQLPGDTRGGVAADAAGHAYVITSGSHYQQWLVRISPDGRRFDTLAKDHLHGGVLGTDDSILLADRDGTTYHLRYGMAVRVLAPDGRLVFISPKAREADEYDRENRSIDD